MILVTVGTHSQGFNRLVRAMDELAAELDEPVIIQRGISSYEPQHAEHFQFTTSQRMVELTRQARIIVTHAAAGAIITARREGNPLVVVPRLKRFDEVFNDHQVQLARVLSARGWVVAVNDPSVETLRQALNQIIRQPSSDDKSSQLINALRQQLDAWSLSTGQRKGSTVKEA